MAHFALLISIPRVALTKCLQDEEYDSDDSVNLDNISESDRSDSSISMDDSLDGISTCSESESTGSIMDLKDTESNVC